MKKFVVLLTLLSVMLFCQGVFAQAPKVIIDFNGEGDSYTYNFIATATDFEISKDESPDDCLQKEPAEFAITVDPNTFTFTYTTEFVREPALGENPDIIKPVVVNPTGFTYTFNVRPVFGDLTWGEAVPQPEAINLLFREITLVEGDTYIVLYTVLPISADQAVEFIIENPAIATVDPNGLITALRAGTTQIIVRTVANPDVQEIITLTVNRAEGNGGFNIFNIGPARPVGNFCNECTLPATGFSGRVATKLSEQPASVNYTSLNMRVQIPSLNVDAEIATVPVVDNVWAVEWLGDKAGLLSGTYLPGEGTAILAGHNTLNTTEWGPFAMLATLDVNDAIFVTDANNELKSFRVYANELLGPNDMEKLASIAETFENSLVLVTCENEAVSGGYMNRRVVFAKPN